MDERSLLEYLKPQERKEYAALQALFETEGWRVLLRKLEAAEQMQVQLCASAEEPKYLYRGQGRLAFLREMLSYEENVRLGVQALCAERALESEIEAELGSPGNDG